MFTSRPECDIFESELWVQWVPFQHGEQGNPLHCNPCCCPLRLDLGAAVACCSNGTLDGTKSGDGRVRRNRSCRARGAIDGRAGPMSWDSVPGTPDRRLWLWKTRTCEPTRDGDDRRWLAGRNDRKAPRGLHVMRRKGEGRREWRVAPAVGASGVKAPVAVGAVTVSPVPRVVRRCTVDQAVPWALPVAAALFLIL